MKEDGRNIINMDKERGRRVLDEELQSNFDKDAAAEQEAIAEERQRLEEIALAAEEEKREAKEAEEVEAAAVATESEAKKGKAAFICVGGAIPNNEEGNDWLRPSLREELSQCLQRKWRPVVHSPSSDAADLVEMIKDKPVMTGPIAPNQTRLFFIDPCGDLDVQPAWLHKNSPFRRMPPVDFDATRKYVEVFASLAGDQE